MNMIKGLMVAAAAGAFSIWGSLASAVPCAGATITTIDGSSVGSIDASACEGFAGNVGSGSTLVNGLNAGTIFSGEFALGTTWIFAGKDETSANSGADVEADVDSPTGNWSADFGTDVVNNVVVGLKGGQGGSVLFLFKELATSGSLFAGLFDMQAAGLVNKKGVGQDLSNLTVAGVFIQCDPQVRDCDDGGTGGEIPLPAGLPLLLTAFGAFGIMRARKKS